MGKRSDQMATTWSYQLCDSGSNPLFVHCALMALLIGIRSFHIQAFHLQKIHLYGLSTLGLSQCAFTTTHNFEWKTWRSTVINPISSSPMHYFHQYMFKWRKHHFYQYNALTRILCMNPISISVKKASFLSTELLLINNSLHESSSISVKVALFSNYTT